MSRDRPRIRPKSYMLIIKSTKYYKHQKIIFYMKRVLYVLRKICLLIEAIINITNNKKYRQKYYKYCRKYYKCDRKYYKNIKIYEYERKYCKNIQSIINMAERRPPWRAIIALRLPPLNKLRKHVLSMNDLKPFEIIENLME